MTKYTRLLLAGSAIAALCFCPAMAQSATPQTPPGQDQQYPSTAPSSPDTHQMVPGDQTMTPQSPAAPSGTASQDLTGQIVYNAKGRQIGTVSSMTVDAKGEQAAVVSIEKYLGMGGEQVEFPVSSLVPRESGGGYTTTLTASEIKHLHKYTSGSGD